MRPLKILTLLTYYRPHWTGLTQNAAAIAEGLAARGHEVTVLTSRHDPSLPRRERIAGVNIFRLRPLARFSRGFIVPHLPLVAQPLIREHDVVHVHTPYPEALAVAWLSRRLDRPLVMTHQGDLVMPAGRLNQAIQRAGTSTMRRTQELATSITALSADYAEHSDFLRPFLDKTTSIFPPIRIPEPDPEVAAAWRRELELDAATVVGFVGRFVEEKGFDYLLRAIPLLLGANPSVHLVHAGEREMGYERFYARCRALIDPYRERVTFVGLLGDRHALANFYAMCDVVAVPSRTDSFASVQVEAMLCGTPVVCSDIPGAREVVRETGMGELVSPGDPDALADAILRVSSDRATYVARAGVVRAVFDADRSVDEYERVLVEAHGARRRSASAPGSLTDADRALLDRILRNEADMAFRRRTRKLLEYLELRDGDGVLDVGCGMGFSLMAMSKLRDVTLTGIDSDPERLAWAQREGVPAEFVHADAERLPFADDSFDKVLASEVLEHLTDDCAALVEMARVLRPGGVLAISVPNARFPFAWDPSSGALRAMGRPGFRTGRVVGIWTNHVRLYTAEDLSERVRGAGLELEILEETTHYTVPFQHFLVYGIGKPLFERGLLPERLRRSADRFAGQENSGSLIDPFNAGRAVFRAIDRLNDRPEAPRKRTHVNVLVKARKPPAPRS